MYINYLDLFSIRFSPDDGSITEFLEQEYKDLLSSSATNDHLIDLELTAGERSASDYILRDPVSYDKLGTYIFDNKNRKLRIDFLTLGNKYSFVKCDPNFHPPFFAILIDFFVSIYALKKNKLLIHSTSFIFDNNVILCPAWRNVGKTNLMLNFMSHGARYLADDWCLIDENGSIESIPKRICLFDYNLSAFPDLAMKIESSLLPMIEFLEITKEGKIEITNTADQDIRKNMVKRINASDLFPNQLCDQSKPVDFIFYLKKGFSSANASNDTVSLATEDLVRRTYETIRLEQKPFRLAYAVQKARTGIENSILIDERSLFFKIARNAFNSSKKYELHVESQNVSKYVMSSILKKIGTK